MAARCNRDAHRPIAIEVEGGQGTSSLPSMVNVRPTRLPKRRVACRVARVRPENRPYAKKATKDSRLFCWAALPGLKGRRSSRFHAVTRRRDEQRGFQGVATQSKSLVSPTWVR